MTGLSEETWIYLHVLVRFFCRRRSIDKIKFARDVGRQHVMLIRAGDAGVLSEVESHGRERDYANLEEAVSKRVNEFLVKGTLKHVRDYQKAVDTVLRTYLDAVKKIDGHDLITVYDHLLRDEGIDGDEACLAFFEFCGSEPDLLPKLSKRLTSLRRDDDAGPATPASFKNAIGKVFNIAASDFDDSAYPVAPYDRRLDNRHFLLVRRSSQHQGDLITHGLKFARHDRNRDFMYFSEKYNANRNGKRHENAGRESRGVCFFDGGYVKALARPASGHTLTYLVGRLPVDDGFDVFPAMITTSNSARSRICAPSIAIAVPDADFKHAHTGVFAETDISKVFEGDRLSALCEWLNGEGKTRPFTL